MARADCKGMGGNDVNRKMKEKKEVKKGYEMFRLVVDGM